MSDIDIEAQLQRMTPHDRAGQLIMGLNDPTGVSDAEELIRRHRIGSVMSYGYHLLSPQEAAERNEALRQATLETGLPPLLNGGDFEQGLASQIGSGVTAFPHQMGMAATGDPEGAERAATIAGQEALALGFSWTFAPIVDVNVNPENPVIGVRSYGSDIDTVCNFARHQIAGYREAGILCCAKHFPGHGDTSVDSHLNLPTIDGDRDTFDRVHLAPFRAAFAAGVDSIMTAHIVVQCLDPDLPATLSRRILTGLLREELGFTGLVVTDLMTMKAIADRWSTEESTVMAIAAGADIVMAAGPTGDTIRAVEAVALAIERGDLDAAQVDRSVARILAAKSRMSGVQPVDDPAARVGTPESRGFARTLFDRSITVLRNDGTLPFDPNDTGTILVLGTPVRSASGRRDASYAPLVADLIRETTRADVLVWQSETMDPTEQEIASATESAGNASRLVLMTYGYGRLPEGQVALARALAGTGKPLVALATGLPYEADAYPEVGTAIACYALNFVPFILSTPEAFASSVRVLFGA